MFEQFNLINKRFTVMNKEEISLFISSAIGVAEEYIKASTTDHVVFIQAWQLPEIDIEEVINR
jgi:hypothetical protein